MYKKLLYALSAIVLVLLLSQCAIGRNKKGDQTPPPPPTGKKATDQRCYRNGSLSAAERSGRYPFSKAGKIIFIAFNEETGKTPVQNGLLDTGQVNAMKELDPKQVHTLTDLIFNYNYSKKNQFSVHSEPGCYIPRNAILFTDVAGLVFAYIEICFECYQYRPSEEQVDLGVSCEGKLDLLKKLFNDAGVATTFAPFNAPAPVLRPLPGGQQ